jgi:hypothetical protein
MTGNKPEHTNCEMQGDEGAGCWLLAAGGVRRFPGGGGAGSGSGKLGAWRMCGRGILLKVQTHVSHAAQGSAQGSIDSRQSTAAAAAAAHITLPGNKLIRCFVKAKPLNQRVSQIREPRGGRAVGVN